MYIYVCIFFIRLYYKYLYFFYKLGYIIYIYCFDIFLFQSVEYCQFFDIFFFYYLNMKLKEKFFVDCYCKVNMFGCDIFYRIFYLLLIVQICFVKMIKSMYYYLIDFVVFKKCYYIFLINFFRILL